jgi:hypothetical protein
MSELGPAVESEQELRCRAWQEKCRRSDQRTEKRMKNVCMVAGIILFFVMILYFWFRAGSTPKGPQPVVAAYSVAIQS